ncbi:MAG: flagellar export chaperone FliS [Phycisphaerae bacterium]|nr:flagellar export chaperone FliS [Phycisphaerae bacterium]
MNAVDAYREHTVTTQTRGRLIVLLYDGAIKFLRLALQELDAGHQAEKGLYIGKAQAILMELNTCLDMDAGGEIASNLRNLYHFMDRHLNDANLHRDGEKIRQVITCLEDLNESWKAISA